MSRSQKVNEPETMSTASAYLYKEQAECVQQVHQYLVEHLDSRVTQAELAAAVSYLSYFAERGVQTGVRLANQYLPAPLPCAACGTAAFHNGFEHFGDRTAGWVRQPQPFCGNV